MIKIEDLEFMDYMSSDNGKGFGLYVKSTYELYTLANKVRRFWGRTELFEIGNGQDKYHDFYVDVFLDEQRVTLRFCTKGTVEDDYVWYDIPLKHFEEKQLLYKVIDYLSKEIERR